MKAEVERQKSEKNHYLGCSSDRATAPTAYLALSLILAVIRDDGPCQPVAVCLGAACPGAGFSPAAANNLYFECWGLNHLARDCLACHRGAVRGG
ncbi:hypothetical protein E2C01_052671 [Portunus trituberculatus]|uniref:Uncharacterized protein n=1 Tax=Portunus trituberculatus TaxID=210409 RepID=A0A5B7GQ05_PORTR|nr:hypothetical protein [Portunus trituberculatus]